MFNFFISSQWQWQLTDMITIGWSKSNNQTCLSRQTTSRTYIITRPGLAGRSYHQRIYHHSTFHVMTKAFHSFSLFLPLFFCCMPNPFPLRFPSFFYLSFSYSLIMVTSVMAFIVGLFNWRNTPYRAFIFCFFFYFPIFSFLSFDLLSLTSLDIYAVQQL